MVGWVLVGYSVGSSVGKSVVWVVSLLVGVGSTVLTVTVVRLLGAAVGARLDSVEGRWEGSRGEREGGGDGVMDGVNEEGAKLGLGLVLVGKFEDGLIEGGNVDAGIEDGALDGVGVLRDVCIVVGDREGCSVGISEGFSVG